MPRKKVEKDPTLISRTLDVKMEHITAITAFAITSQSLSFRKYAERLIAAEAKSIKKNKKSLIPTT